MCYAAVVKCSSSGCAALANRGNAVYAAIANRSKVADAAVAHRPPLDAGEPSASSVAVTNFFHRVGARQYDPLSWRQYMSREGKLTLRLTVVGAAVD